MGVDIEKELLAYYRRYYEPQRLNLHTICSNAVKQAKNSGLAKFFESYHQKIFWGRCSPTRLPTRVTAA